MSIEFREIRRGEIGDALAFVAGQGAEVQRATVQTHFSLTALDAERAIVGSALHLAEPEGRRRIVVHLAPDAELGLAKLLIDRALRKAEGGDVATARVEIQHPEAEQATWADNDWLARLEPASPEAERKTEPPATATAA